MTKDKASLDQLNGLHGMVAKQLASNLDDPKMLAHAIKFLKDNEITADIVESETMMSLTQSIQKIAQQAAQEESMSVEDMLKTSTNAH
tara:strand:- start:1868 stop:2131 length:264 start_codon:yes stop_codon:yes gene_type:complete